MLVVVVVVMVWWWLSNGGGVGRQTFGVKTTDDEQLIHGEREREKKKERERGCIPV